MKTEDFKISIIIPNYNGRRLLEKHLPKVLTSTKQKDEVIIVDDLSEDDSVSFVERYYPQVKIIKKTSHEGFSSTVNTGVKAAKGDIVLLLNTDIEPEDGFMSPLIKHFDDPQVFAVGCMDRSHENDKVVLRGRGIARWEKGFYIHERGEVDKSDTAWVSGGSGAFRRSMWQELEGMDERFNPFYWEDIDLSYRAMKKGWKLIFENESIVDHFHESGSIKSGYDKNIVKQIAYRNQFLFMFKNSSINQRFYQTFWIPVRLIQAVLSSDWAMMSGFIAAIKLVVTK